MVVIDGDVKNSTYTEFFADAVPSRFIESYIAEQNMVGIANGLASRGVLPVSSTFAAFLTRAFDQLRMAQYAGTHQVYIGTHAGVSIGQDGFSQMGLEDIAMFRTLANCSIFYPSDAYSAERLVELALSSKGLAYIRATRAELPLLYDGHTAFRLGGSRTLRSSRHDKATIVAAGVTVHEALKAADVLAKAGTRVRVIDLHSIKPIDRATLLRAAEQTKHVLVVEDHRPEGGIAEAVRSALGKHAGTVRSLAVTRTPHSGTPEQLLAYEGIDADAIAEAVRLLR
jgi:transketolase